MSNAIDYLSGKIKTETGDLYVGDIENAKRLTRIRKPSRAIEIFKELINYYLVRNLITWFEKDTNKVMPKAKTHHWMNLGGQLVTANQLEKLLSAIERGSIPILVRGTP
jgi:hypothetical protein